MCVKVSVTNVQPTFQIFNPDLDIDASRINQKQPCYSYKNVSIYFSYITIKAMRNRFFYAITSYA